MSDWEEELDNEESKPEEQKVVEPAKEEVEESEEIIKVKKEYKAPVQEATDKVDYEKKYNEKHKDIIESTKEIDNAVAGIKDEQLQNKKKLELQRIKQAEKFLGSDANEAKATNLLVEKDFIELSNKTAAKINESKKPSKFTFSFLKNSIELLAHTLDSDKINDLLKVTTVIFNKKLKEENANSKKKSKKPNINAGKAIERSERRGLYETYGGNDDYEEEEYEDDDFM